MSPLCIQRMESIYVLLDRRRSRGRDYEQLDLDQDLNIPIG